MKKIATVKVLPAVQRKSASKYDPYLRAAERARGDYVVTPAGHASAVLGLAKRRGLSVATRAGTVYVFKQRAARRRARSK